MEGTTTIKVDNGELYVRGDTIVGRKVVDGNSTTYYRGNEVHREGGPAQVYTTGDGITCTGFYRDGDLHNESGPAITQVRSDGLVMYEVYAIDGKYHRVGAPAVIVRSDSNVTEDYWVDGFHKNIKKQIGNSDGYEAIRHDLAHVRTKLDVERREHATCRNSLTQAELAVGGMREERDDARDKLAAVTSAHDDLRVQFNLAKDEISGLRAALETTRAELENENRFAQRFAHNQSNKIYLKLKTEYDKQTAELAAMKQKIRALIDE